MDTNTLAPAANIRAGSFSDKHKHLPSMTQHTGMDGFKEANVALYGDRWLVKANGDITKTSY